MPYSADNYWKSAITAEVRVNKSVWSKGDWQDVKARIVRWMYKELSPFARSNQMFEMLFEAAKTELLR